MTDETSAQTSKKRSRVWIASKGTEKALTLYEADGWEVHEVVKAPVCRPNSPEDIRQSMDLLQQIHREAPGNETREVQSLTPLEWQHLLKLKDDEMAQLRYDLEMARGPSDAPETLVAWIGADYWRCRCKAPASVNVGSNSMCRDCGTARPEKANTLKADEGQS